MLKLGRSLSSYLSSKIFVIRNNEGTFIVKGGNDSLAIVSSYFEREQKKWLDIPTQRELFVDIGSNRGIYSILALKRYGFKRVIAFEPQSIMVHELIQNTRLNAVEQQMTVHPCALGAHSGHGSLLVDQQHFGGGRLINGSTTGDVISVPVKPLDFVLTSEEKENIGFIKIDTEGYEFQVLEGMTDTLSHMPSQSLLMIESIQHSLLAENLIPYSFKHISTIGHDHLFRKSPN